MLTCLLVGLGLAFAFSERAEAGYGVHPNGDSFAVTTDSSGYIESPKTLDFVVYLDGQDSSAYVWISESPTISTYGTPVGSSVGGCSQGELIPFGEPNKWVCRDSTILLKPGRTYYWWLDFRRLEPGQAFAEDRISGPFSFTLTQAVPPPVPTPPPAVEPTPVPTYTPPVSTKTSKSAATLPSADVFDRGGRSIKHARLTKLVYETMKGIGLPRTLAIACWNPLDWQSVVESEGGQTQDGDSVLLGFWLPWQPRWLHIAPNVCRDVQGLLSTRLLNERRAYAVTTVLHETAHAYGVKNEAEANCYAVQLVPVFGWAMRMPRVRAEYMGTLARNLTRRRAPSGYWNAAKCRDGGAWDLWPDYRNL